MITKVGVPTSQVDPFSADFMDNPWPHFAALREESPVTWLSKYGIWAATGYREVATGLCDFETFCSGADTRSPLADSAGFAD